MNKQGLKRSLITIGLLVLVGAVGVQTYYTYRLSRRLEAVESGGPAVTLPAPPSGQSDPWTAMRAEMKSMQERMDRMFEGAFQGSDSMPGSALRPDDGEVTLDERGGSYVVTADIPGAKDGDIDVNLDGRLLSISSKSQGQNKETSDNGQVTRQERYSSSNQRAFTLPGPVDASRMHSQFKDGVLTVTIPKAD